MRGIERMEGGERVGVRVIKLMTKDLTHFAKELRKKSTDAERLLWRRLRAGRFAGMKFRRQHPIGPYIVDFVCLERRLIIELDGGQHNLPEKVTKDRWRYEWLHKEGYTAVRFWDNEVLTNINGVLETIRKKLNRTPSPLSPPLNREGKVPIQNKKEPIKCF